MKKNPTGRKNSLTGLQKMTKWVTPSFDADISLSNNQLASSKSQKRNLSNAFGEKEMTIKAANTNNSTDQTRIVKRAHVDNILMWTDKHAPSSQADLAVHKKKIQELETWLQDNLHGRKRAPVLLLTGPAGVGKTTTLKVLAKQLKCEIQEWVNPVIDSSFNYQTDFSEYSRVAGSSYQSEKNLFQDFLLRANKYGSLDIFGGDHYAKKLVLVEDYPNTFFRDPSAFHQVVRKYVMVGSCPLVFIISDSTHGNSNEKLLFPKDFQDELNIDHVSFNPVALTILTKVLTRIATQESIKGTFKFSIPSKMTLESLALSSNGDIRGAVNALQFACLKDCANIYSQRPASKTKSKSSVSKVKHKQSNKNRMEENTDSMPCIGGKDTSLFLFHALGKILYCKREEPESNENQQSTLPPHLSHHHRSPLVENPEEVVSKSHMSGDLFSAFLQQNYVNFFESIDELERASEYLSDADLITVDWATRSTLQDYTVSLVTRGIMHSNTTIGRSKETKGWQAKTWRPLHKPEYFSVQKKVKERCQTVQEIFTSQLCRNTPVELFTELVPYLNLTRTSLQSPFQKSIVKEIATFPKFKSRFLEKLEEGYLVGAETQKSDAKESQSSQSIIASDKEVILEDEEDEIVIEEFDD